MRAPRQRLLARGAHGGGLPVPWELPGRLRALGEGLGGPGSQPCVVGTGGPHELGARAGGSSPTSLPERQCSACLFPLILLWPQSPLNPLILCTPPAAPPPVFPFHCHPSVITPPSYFCSLRAPPLLCITPPPPPSPCSSSLYCIPLFIQLLCPAQPPALPCLPLGAFLHLDLLQLLSFLRRNALSCLVARLAFPLSQGCHLSPSN